MTWGVGFVPLHLPSTPLDSQSNSHTQLCTGHTLDLLRWPPLPHGKIAAGRPPISGENPARGMDHPELLVLLFALHEGEKRAPTHLPAQGLWWLCCFPSLLSPSGKLLHSSPDLRLGISLLLSPEFSSVALCWSQATWGGREGPLGPVGWSAGMRGPSSLRTQCGVGTQDFSWGSYYTLSFCARHRANSFYMRYLSSSSQKPCIRSY